MNNKLDSFFKMCQHGAILLQTCFLLVEKSQCAYSDWLERIAQIFEPITELRVVL